MKGVFLLKVSSEELSKKQVEKIIKAFKHEDIEIGYDYYGGKNPLVL